MKNRVTIVEATLERERLESGVVSHAHPAKKSSSFFLHSHEQPWRKECQK